MLKMEPFKIKIWLNSEKDDKFKNITFIPKKFKSTALQQGFEYI